MNASEPEVRFVLDASIVITWAMRDEDHPHADFAFDRLRTGSAVVPAIWWYELHNILLVCERRGRITSEDATRFLRELEAFSIDLIFPHDGSSVVTLARKHALSFYDAAYLVIAQSEHIPLSTLDRALEAAARAEGIPLLA